MPRIDIDRALIEALPCYHRITIPEDYRDIMGHMNVRWYLAIFDTAGWHFFAAQGMDDTYYAENQAGGFALKQFITYLNEVLVGDTVAVYGRLLGMTDKRIHKMYFMINETRANLACVLETLGSHADMSIRKTAPYPPYIADRLQALLDEHQALSWAAPVSGAITL